ncbi:unannotated protein [freshwater metagenome]|uniref:Unannotated protein n=1 Tax=freshwater metagenome TaxID=449393 RepID=A0A6J7DAP3_9ZZZZ|nr:DUF3048 domain-containing protein [Actinomycetota bacterium]MUH58043.1 DUF3048 domain-containing protein [Actinomycetota bacterium]
MKKLGLLVVLVVLGVGVWTTQRDASWWPGSSTTTSSEITTTTAPVIAPLSGTVDSSGLSATRPALTIKIENTPDARPQWGVDQADVVYEEIVEGGITRLAAVFQSKIPGRVGPVRSVRRTDQAIVWPIGGLFAYSGGAPYAVQSIQAAPVAIYSETSAREGMFRDHSRYAPHNLFAVPAKLWLHPGTPTPPPALFRYRAPGDKTGGKKSGGFLMGFRSGYATSFRWNAVTKSWDRTIFAAPDITATKVRISPKNVVVMWITYKGGVGVMGAEGIMVGTGRSMVMTNGRTIAGTWSRSSKDSRVIYRDRKGVEINMTPGQTWVELAATDDPVTLFPVN